ncbi:hypothetical protein BU26DRAFT_99356 [Trematosphaeria pertusa]|uniref:Uncharacterized protein n=1 Tax=Trematosphaeria pertusa TaxID=390896 RepID=A0A6A6I253_9PLEO|nr:uncharacterized protein BU26DRAFT_99356 [Trematosphaeria pertusa]KAF2244357.1 hypothetical protein BU26DRAFT_99356 [Trematosphaeria pertusa]
MRLPVRTGVLCALSLPYSTVSFSVSLSSLVHGSSAGIRMRPHRIPRFSLLAEPCIGPRRHRRLVQASHRFPITPREPITAQDRHRSQLPRSTARPHPLVSSPLSTSRLASLLSAYLTTTRASSLSSRASSQLLRASIEQLSRISRLSPDCVENHVIPFVPSSVQ